MKYERIPRNLFEFTRSLVNLSRILVTSGSSASHQTFGQSNQIFFWRKIISFWVQHNRESFLSLSLAMHVIIYTKNRNVHRYDVNVADI